MYIFLSNSSTVGTNINQIPMVNASENTNFVDLSHFLQLIVEFRHYILAVLFLRSRFFGQLCITNVISYINFFLEKEVQRYRFWKNNRLSTHYNIFTQLYKLYQSSINCNNIQYSYSKLFSIQLNAPN